MFGQLDVTGVPGKDQRINVNNIIFYLKRLQAQTQTVCSYWGEGNIYCIDDFELDIG